MKRINVLNTETTNKIAAGEVVERPSSVVKELVENSIDAEAKNITVEIFDGGQESIKITDDGIGIHPDDVERAFLTHATSKISTVEDIYKITTLGFRGEALPSIASVSNVTLKSRRDGFDFGKEIHICGGKIEDIKEIGCSKGTTMEVRNLFFNVPARQKFLKSSQRESALISDSLMRLALANPNISFKFLKNGKKAFSTYGTDDLKETIRALYGKEVFNNIISFEKHSDIASIHGYIGNSEISRGSRNRQSIFVNKRLIKSPMITAAVENAFKSFLTINKFPFFVLFIDIYPEYIDVNVHPTKSEIKFQEDRSIFKLVFDSVHEALKKSLTDSFNIPVDEEENDIEENISAGREISSNSFQMIKDNKEEYKSLEMNQIPIDLKSISKESSGEMINKGYMSFDLKGTTQSDREETKNDLSDDNKEISNFKEYVLNKQKDVTESNIIAENNDKDFHQQDLVVNRKEELEVPKEEIRYAKFPELRVIGQFNKTYIIGEVNSELYLIDQHAAHEKILFEQYMREVEKRQVISQILLTPLVQELSPEEFIYYMENEKVFKDAGFIIEDFGENTISIREVPVIIGKLKIKKLFLDILDDLKNMGNGKTSDRIFAAIARKACRAAVKAHDKLSNEEMNYLVNNLRYIDEPFTCPHGRPTIIRFTLTELEKKFKRIQ